MVELKALEKDQGKSSMNSQVGGHHKNVLSHMTRKGYHRKFDYFMIIHSHVGMVELLNWTCLHHFWIFVTNFY